MKEMDPPDDDRILFRYHVTIEGLSVNANGKSAQNDEDLADTGVHRINEMINGDDKVWGQVKRLLKPEILMRKYAKNLRAPFAIGIKRWYN